MFITLLLSYLYSRIYFISYLTSSSAGKESACNVGDPGSIPGLERSAGEGIGYLLQYFWAFPGGSAGKESACNVGAWV